MSLAREIQAWRRIAAAGLAALAVSAVQAQEAQEPPQAMLESTQRWLDGALTQAQQSSEAASLRMEVSVGSLDSRLRLAPCAKVEPYLPAGVRLWGKIRLGLRCLEGSSRWNVFLPVTVKAFGPAWVLKSGVMPGAVLTADDAMVAEADWAEEPSPVMPEPGQWVGQVASRQLMAGQPIRQSMIKPAQVFQAGAQVRVVAQGPGFLVSSDGQALTAGAVGQTARVRMDNGRVMSGVVLDARTVKLEL